MKIRRGSLLIVLVLFIQVFLVECGCCDEPDTFCLEFTGLEIKNQDNQGEVILDQYQDTIPAAAYVISVVFENKESFCLRRGYDLKLMNAAYALSCPRDEYIYDDRISSIEIKTNGLWNSQGDSIITDQFIANNDITNLNNQILDGHSYIQNEFHLAYYPEFEDEHQIILTYTMESGIQLKDTTDLVVLSL